MPMLIHNDMRDGFPLAERRGLLGDLPVCCRLRVFREAWITRRLT